MTPHHSGSVPKLIQLIDDAVEDQARWPNFLAALCEVLKTTHAFLVLHVPGNQFDSQVVSKSMQLGSAHGWTGEQLQLYAQRYAHSDPLKDAINELEEGAVLRTTELSTGAEFYSSVAYREFYRPIGCHHGCGVLIKRSGQGLSFLSLIRSEDAGAYTDSELSVLKLLLPHLQRGARLIAE